MANAKERAQRAENALRRIENTNKKAAERQRREKISPVNVSAVSTAGPRSSATSAATSGAHTLRPTSGVNLATLSHGGSTPRPTSEVNPARLSHGGGTARPSSCATGEAGPNTTISDIYTTAGQASAAASAAVPAGKVDAGTLIPVSEIDGAATHIVLVAGQRRIGFFLQRGDHRARRGTICVARGDGRAGSSHHWCGPPGTVYVCSGRRFGGATFGAWPRGAGAAALPLRRGRPARGGGGRARSGRRLGGATSGA